MKIIRYATSQNEPMYGAIEDGTAIHAIKGSLFEGFTVGDKVAELGDQIEILPPIMPGKIICVGLNYVSHIEEMNLVKPTRPMLFAKPATTVIGNGENIVYPKGSSRVDFEAELTVVIGKEARRVSEDRALDVVLGYTCANDVSERDIQFAEMKSGAMLIGKGFDTFCPLGPVIATDLDPTNLDVITRLNGEVKQKGNTSDLLFSVANLISYISQAMTLLPGDIILTGTPSGVGPIKPNDVVEIEVPGIGILRNPVTAER